MKPWYQKKKIWVAVLTGLGAGITSYFGNDQYAQMLMAIGMTLIGALGLEDIGKAKKA